MSTVPKRALNDDLAEVPRPPRRRLTETEFEEWCTGDTWAEWIDGEVILMSPVNYHHADLLAFLLGLIRGFVEEKSLGVVLTEPFQVRFGRLRRRRSPDIFFVSNRRRSLIKHTYFDGPPDLIIEIASPSSFSRDWRDKHEDYRKAGVREYWVFDPAGERVEAYRLQGDSYTVIPLKDHCIRSHVLRGFFIRPEWLWSEPHPKVSTLLRSMLGGPR